VGGEGVACGLSALLALLEPRLHDHHVKPPPPHRRNNDNAPQAFEVVTRPALDSVEAALDRAKMAIYTQFAAWGLPCPITGHPNSGKFVAGGGEGDAAAARQQHEGSSGGTRVAAS